MNVGMGGWGNNGPQGMANSGTDAAGANAAWQQYQDARLGFRTAFPNGWQIRADEQAIHVRNADGTLFVLVVPFFENGMGGDVLSRDAAWIGRLPAVFPMLFPQAMLQRITPPASPDADTIGAFVYQSPQGPGEARVLCSRRAAPAGRGMLFAIAAPAYRFETEKATLIRILESFVFGADSNGATQQPTATTQTSNATDNAAMERAVAEAAKQITWVSWKDPHEASFSVEVPSGWTVEGGLFRFGVTDPRQAVQGRSPEGDIVIQRGDPGLPLFTPLTPMMMQMGLREGQIYSPTGNFQAMAANYMPAPVFSRWYLAQFLAAEVSGITPTTEQNLQEFAQQQRITMQQMGQQAQVEALQVEFTGTSKRTGKRVTGVVVVSVIRFPDNPLGPGAWFAQPMWAFSTDGDDAAEARKVTGTAALLHLLQSWQDDPAWVARNNQVQAQINQQMQQQQNQTSQRQHEMAMDNIRAAGERSRIIANASDDRRKATMNAYWQRQAAQDNVQRQFVNYVGDRTDVRDTATGQAWNVGSGYRHYYHNDRTNTIIGTDSADQPGVDWTPMREF